MELQIELGRKIKALRKKKRLSIHDIALKTGISVDRLLEIEEGKGILTVNEVECISNVLGLGMYSVEMQNYKLFAIKSIILCMFGMCICPLLAIFLQLADQITGFSNGSGFYSNSMVYLYMSPLKYLMIFFSINILGAAIFLLLYKKRNGGKDL